MFFLRIFEIDDVIVAITTGCCATMEGGTCVLCNFRILRGVV